MVDIEYYNEGPGIRTNRPYFRDTFKKAIRILSEYITGENKKHE